jgi:uncharacterized membrane protein
MQLSPEDRRKIYEEEKARIEANEKQQIAADSSTTGMKPNVAGLLCYLAGWITGIIFLVLEQKDNFVRFHAIQSIITFGVLTIASALLSWIPFVGVFFGAIIGILAFILWIVLMVKAYHGEQYELPVAGNIAKGILPAIEHGEKARTDEGQKATEPSDSSGDAEKTEVSVPTSATSSKKAEERRGRVDDYFKHSRAGRMAGYSAAIFWSLVLIIFFSFFYQYIAWYHFGPDGSITRLPLLTNVYFIWLPILVIALILSIAGNIVLIIHDRYWLHQIIKIVLNVIGVVVVVNLVSIFPFNFNVIPNNTAVYVVPIVVTIVLILIAVGLGVGALVRFIRLIVNIAKKKPN